MLRTKIRGCITFKSYVLYLNERVDINKRIFERLHLRDTISNLGQSLQKISKDVGVPIAVDMSVLIAQKDRSDK